MAEKKEKQIKEKQVILDRYEYTIEDVPLSEILVDEVHPDAGFAKSHKHLGHTTEVVLNRLSTLTKEKRYVVVDGRKTVNELLNEKKGTVKARVYKNLPGDVGAYILLVRNLQQSCSPIVEAEAIRDLMGRHRKTQQEISEITGVTPSVISQRLSLLELPKSIQESLKRNEIPYSVALRIHGMPKDVQNKIAKEKTITGDLVGQYHRRYLDSQLEFEDMDLPEKAKGKAAIKNYSVAVNGKETSMTRRELLSGIDEMVAGLSKGEEMVIRRI